MTQAKTADEESAIFAILSGHHRKVRPARPARPARARASLRFFGGIVPPGRTDLLAQAGEKVGRGARDRRGAFVLVLVFLVAGLRRRAARDGGEQLIDGGRGRRG